MSLTVAFQFLALQIGIQEFKDTVLETDISFTICTSGMLLKYSNTPKYTTLLSLLQPFFCDPFPQDSTTWYTTATSIG